mmetsp:Transcript_6/g.19  ORF Transcript_6/g.19 Transcript_6/m.19 type:complete len:158 (+) Transcript_6:233-706(+)
MMVDGPGADLAVVAKGDKVAHRDGFPEVLSVARAGVELIVTQFADRWVVYVSELAKVGAILECHKDDRVNTYTVEVLLGDREDQWSRLFGRQLASKSRGKPLVVMFSLDLRGLEDAEIMAKLRVVIGMFADLVRPSDAAAPAASAVPPLAPPPGPIA